MPVRRISRFIPRQTFIASSADIPTPTETQASTIATYAPTDTLPTIPGTTTNDPTSSSTSSSESLALSSTQPTSSQDITTTTSSQSQSSTTILTSDIKISSTSPNVLTSTFTSQASISSTSSTPSAPTVASSPLATSSLSSAPLTTPNYIATPTSNRGQITSYITSSYVTVVGTSTFTTESLIPTIISADASNDSAGNRTAIIAGSVIGGGLLLILTLSIFFYRQRQRFKRFHSLDIMNVRRRQARARATLLAGEDLDDVTLSRPPPGRYTDYDSPWDPRDSLGSFGDSQRGTLVDPLMHGADVDLSHIVDDVMGPSISGPDMHYYQNSVSSSYRDFPGRDEPEMMTERNPQTRELSNASQIALLEAAGLARPSPSDSSLKPEDENAPIGASISTGNQL